MPHLHQQSPGHLAHQHIELGAADRELIGTTERGPDETVLMQATGAQPEPSPWSIWVRRLLNHHLEKGGTKQFEVRVNGGELNWISRSRATKEFRDLSLWANAHRTVSFMIGDAAPSNYEDLAQPPVKFSFPGTGFTNVRPVN